MNSPWTQTGHSSAICIYQLNYLLFCDPCLQLLRLVILLYPLCPSLVAYLDNVEMIFLGKQIVLSKKLFQSGSMGPEIRYYETEAHKAQSSWVQAGCLQACPHRHTPHTETAPEREQEDHSRTRPVMGLTRRDSPAKLASPVQLC